MCILCQTRKTRALDVHPTPLLARRPSAAATKSTCGGTSRCGAIRAGGQTGFMRAVRARYAQRMYILARKSDRSPFYKFTQGASFCGGIVQHEVWLSFAVGSAYDTTPRKAGTQPKVCTGSLHHTLHVFMLDFFNTIASAKYQLPHDRLN